MNLPLLIMFDIHMSNESGATAYSDVFDGATGDINKFGVVDIIVNAETR